MHYLFGAELKLFYNDKGRKLKPREIYEHNIETIGIIVGTEIYSQNVLKILHHLKVISLLIFSNYREKRFTYQSVYLQ